jgi:CTP synthase (UTP-ammonia lyase)
VKHIAILGDFDSANPRHLATEAAIRHSAARLDSSVEGKWIATEEISPSLLADFEGMWVAPGSPYKDMKRVLRGIRYAREKNVPCLGTCGGFQHMVLEYAHNVLNFEDARHAEYDPYASVLYISKLACSLVGREMRLSFLPESIVARAYGALTAVEEYYCDFGVNPEKVGILRNSPLKITGSDAEGEVRVIELPSHPFFVGTLFVPQTRSAANQPHPLVNAFLRAVAEK